MSDNEKELQEAETTLGETITVKKETTTEEEEISKGADITEENAEGNEMQEESRAAKESEDNRVETLSKRLEEIEKEKEELFQNYIRLKADFDNFRRRTREELGQARERGLEDLVTKFLPVLDNLERAIGATGDPGKWREGVEMVFRQFLGLLETEGVNTIPSIGESFDPNKHEAIAREPSEQPENVIIEELRKGYQLKEKTIRPSLVKVSAGEEG